MTGPSCPPAALARRAVLAAALVLATVGAMLAAPPVPPAAAASEGTAPGSAEVLAFGACHTDAEGDTNELDSGAAVDEPRADLVEHCVRYGPTLSLSAEVAEPTDPAEDDNWRGGTFAGWFLDTSGDGSGDYFVDLSLDGDTAELGAQVQQVDGGEPGEAVCDATAVVTGGIYHVSDIDPDCVGGADEVGVNASMFYDTTPGEDGGVYVDTHPGEDDFTAPETATVRTAERLAGAGRIQTAVEIAQRQFPDPGDAERVYLARADVFADAVVGGTVPDGPILLTPSTGEAPADVADEIDRLDPDEVVALGGTAAIADETLADAADGRPTDRFAGSGRLRTAVDISEHVFPGGADEVYLARADLFADAVVGGSLTGGPILLVPSEGEVPEPVRDEIDRVDPDRVVALGGTAAVSDGVLDDMAAGRDADRLAGPGRIETAVEIARYEFPGGTDDVFLARADVFADAVVGGTLTAGPTLLVPSEGQLPGIVAGEISRMAPPQVTALGGAAAISDGILAAARDS